MRAALRHRVNDLNEVMPADSGDGQASAKLSRAEQETPIHRLLRRGASIGPNKGFGKRSYARFDTIVALSLAMVVNASHPGGLDLSCKRHHRADFDQSSLSPSVA